LLNPKDIAATPVSVLARSADRSRKIDKLKKVVDQIEVMLDMLQAVADVGK